MTLNNNLLYICNKCYTKRGFEPTIQLTLRDIPQPIWNPRFTAAETRAPPTTLATSSLFSEIKFNVHIHPKLSGGFFVISLLPAIICIWTPMIPGNYPNSLYFFEINFPVKMLVSIFKTYTY